MNPPGNKSVTPERYIDVCEPRMKDPVMLPLEGWEVGLLHGVIRIAMSVRGVNTLSITSRLAIKRWREFCCTVMLSWGFTEAEVAWLDTSEFEDSIESGASAEFLKATRIEMPIVTGAEICKHAARVNYPTGISRINDGECPRGKLNGAACMLCPYGHMLECHYPKTCEEARCNHYDIERE